MTMRLTIVCGQGPVLPCVGVMPAAADPMSTIHYMSANVAICGQPGAALRASGDVDATCADCLYAARCLLRLNVQAIDYGTPASGARMLAAYYLLNVLRPEFAARMRWSGCGTTACT